MCTAAFSSSFHFKQLQHSVMNQDPSFAFWVANQLLSFIALINELLKLSRLVFSALICKLTFNSLKEAALSAPANSSQ